MNLHSESVFHWAIFLRVERYTKCVVVLTAKVIISTGARPLRCICEFTRRRNAN